MEAIFCMFAAGLVLFMSIDANAASRSNLVMEEFMVPAADAGINLYLRNKHYEGMNTFPAEKILLFVHGSTYPSEAGFDMKLNGLSWMDYIARHCYDVYRGGALACRWCEDGRIGQGEAALIEEIARRFNDFRADPQNRSLTR